MEPSFALPLADIAATVTAQPRVQRASGRARSAVQAAPAPVVVAGQGCTYVRAVTPRVTLQTIADRLGVSRMTVSNAFSRPDQLSDELRLRVLSAAEELGYVGPDPAARALARGTTGAIGVLLTDALSYAFSDEVSTIFLGALVDALGPTGMAVTLLTSNDRHDVVPARDVALDGAIVYSCRPTSPARDWLVRRKLPLVYVDQEPVAGAPSVNVDDRGGARAAAEHVIGLGHRDVGILTIASEGAHPERQRMLGWHDALRAVDLEPTVAQTSSNVEDDAINAALTILTREPRPTAVLCFSDIAALGALRAAAQLGLEVPRDLSIVGFDDSPVARRSHPALTTVRQDLVAKGRLAAESLVSAMSLDRSRPSPRGRHHVLPTELVVRETSGRAPH